MKSNGKNNQNEKSNSFMAGKPDITYQDGMFGSVEGASKAIKAVARFLKSECSGDDDELSGDFSGFIINEIRVDFRSDLKRYRLRTSFGTGVFIIIAPRYEEDTEKELEKRSFELIQKFSATVHEAHMRSCMQFFRSLDMDARKELVDRYGNDVK